ncbi:MAG TPA: LysM domain-containing protein [Luteimonas sp.]|nr:LysM domain-containing protein [Luteimonas sp.]
MANMAYVDGGGTGPIGSPQDRPQTHTVAPGETLREIADRYGVQPSAIRDANPQIFRSDDAARRHDAVENGGEMIWSGDQLNIPAATQSVLEDPMSTEVNPTFPSSNSEYRVGNEKGGITFNPGDGSVKLTLEQQHELASAKSGNPFGIDPASGRSVQFGLRGETAWTVGATNKNGNTEVTFESENGGWLVGSVDVGGRGGASAEVQIGGGARARYKVILPGENRPATEAAQINPFDPTKIPVGATVVLDQQAFTGTMLEGSFRYIGSTTNVKQAEGTAYSATRLSDGTVRVMTGPTKALEAFTSANVGIDGLRVALGKQTNIGESQLRVADFDLTKPDGQAAYAHFVATGQVAHETPGVSNVLSLERTDFSSQTRLQVELGPFSADFAGGQNTGTWVKTSYADGSYSMTMDLQYAGGVPMTLTQRYDTKGNEILSERTYQFKLKPDANQAEQLNWVASGGASEQGAATAGKTVTVTMTEAQMQSFMRQTRAAGDTFGGSSRPAIMAYDETGKPVDSGIQFAVGLVRSQMGETTNFTKTLLQISDGADRNLDRGTWQAIDMGLRSS